MALDFKRITQTFESRRSAEEVGELEETYAAFKTRVVPHCSFPERGEWGDPVRIRAYAIMYRQILLHRAISMFEGSLNAAVEENAYVLALSVRGAFETTAALGYLHNRLASLAEGNLDAEKIDEDIMSQFLGTRDSTLSEEMPPKQILSMLEYADVSVSRSVLGGTAREHQILRESYDFLCEFAHPNFHSNKVAYDLDKANKRLILRHGKEMAPEVFSIVSYLLLASPLHVKLHDAIDEVLPDAL